MGNGQQHSLGGSLRFGFIEFSIVLNWHLRRDNSKGPCSLQEIKRYEAIFKKRGER
jgi:hypothetical protein